MSGEIFSKLITSVNPKIMNSSSRHGAKIDRIIIHHNATTNKNVAMNTWVQGAPANTSAHYEVTPTEIIGCVGEQYSAWHAGGTGGRDIPKISNPDGRSIGIENVNSTGAPSWSVDHKTIINCARLVVDICKRYGIPIDRKHVLGHKEVTATACPGGIDVDEVVKLAKKYAHGSTHAPSGITNSKGIVRARKDGYLVNSKGEKTKHLVKAGSAWKVFSVEKVGMLIGADEYLPFNNSNVRIGKKLTDKFKLGSEWKVVSATIIDGKSYFKLSTTEFVTGEYTA